MHYWAKTTEDQPLLSQSWIANKSETFLTPAQAPNLKLFI